MACELKYHQTHFSQIRSSVYECLAARGPYYHHIKYFYHLLSRLDPVRYFFFHFDLINQISRLFSWFH